MLALVLALASPLPALAVSKPTVLTVNGSNAFRVKPTRIVFGTGFAFGSLNHDAYGSQPIRWTVYNRTQAKGAGTADTNSCRPNCAGGAWTAEAGSITLTRPVEGRFTRLTIRYGGTVVHEKLTSLGSDSWIWG